MSPVVLSFMAREKVMPLTEVKMFGGNNRLRGYLRKIKSILH